MALAHDPDVEPASLSRPLDDAEARAPRLLHALAQKGTSVLSLIADERHIYSGSQANDISVSRVRCQGMWLTAFRSGRRRGIR